MEGCEHTESSPIGTCVICERTVCTECYNEVFGSMICDQHPGLEDESEWALVGHYSSNEGIEERRYALEDGGVASLVVETDDEAVELYVPLDEKDDAFDALTSGGTDQSDCKECKVEYSSDLDSCPVCGAQSEQKSYDDN